MAQSKIVEPFERVRVKQVIPGHPGLFDDRPEKSIRGEVCDESTEGSDDVVVVVVVVASVDVVPFAEGGARMAGFEGEIGGTPSSGSDGS